MMEIISREYQDKIMTCLLTPFSWLYGAATYVRNMLYDKKLLPQEEFNIPIVSVGNITVGGTGKTPHVEYIVTHLATEYNVAILSRGYKRKTKGYVLANSKSTPDMIGDEPYQMYQKFGMVAKVAVCENRAEGIKRLLKEFPKINLVILDDAFQHRSIKPKVSVLLTDYNRPIYKDKILPLGRLRESEHGVTRADFVLVTKCPGGMKAIDYRMILKDLELSEYQKSFFTCYDYRPLKPVFPDDSPYRAVPEELTSADTVLLLTGIAQPRTFVRHFKSYPFHKKIYHFPDHHNFSRQDIDKISRGFEEMTGKRKIIITTEKDAVRLANNPYYPQHLKPLTFFIPIEVRVLEGLKGDDFIGALRRAIEEKENPLNAKYDD